MHQSTILTLDERREWRLLSPSQIKLALVSPCVTKYSLGNHSKVTDVQLIPKSLQKGVSKLAGLVTQQGMHYTSSTSPSEGLHIRESSLIAMSDRLYDMLGPSQWELRLLVPLGNWEALKSGVWASTVLRSKFLPPPRLRVWQSMEIGSHVNKWFEAHQRLIKRFGQCVRLFPFEDRRSALEWGPRSATWWSNVESLGLSSQVCFSELKKDFMCHHKALGHSMIYKVI